MEQTTWRLMITPPMSGAENMALDEALLETITDDNNIPVLRLFDWSPPCLSLGYSQPYSDVNYEKLKELGWDIVRRLTGGRAVLHTNELTYSVIAPLNEDRVKGSIIESYRRLSQALLAALNELSLNARAEKEYILPTQSNKLAPVCFEVPSKYEITVQGKKIIGSAQARKHGGVLQHGSLPLHGDLTRIIEVLNFFSETSRDRAKERLLAHATTIESVLGEITPWDVAANAFIEAFQKTLNIDFIKSDPTCSELERANQFQKDKYRNDEWLQHKKL
ncbi:MAG: lipoate--protein ligase family protein [Anaerolineaceae bacterium]|nr:lipoate--protein ligase family protein [Anaerolineaceae bacterium]